MRARAMTPGVLLATAFLAASLSANDGETVTVSVPFRFLAGDMSFASGEYVFMLTESDAVTLRDGDGQHLRLPANLTVRAMPGREGSGVVFRRFGQQNILAEIYAPGLRGAYELSRGAVEGQLRSAGRRSDDVAISAQRE